MKSTMFVILVLVSTILQAQKTKQEILKNLDGKADQYATIAKKIWGFAEVGYQEIQSSSLLQQTLKDAGFTVQNNVAGMPTAFVASYGSGKPVIGILGDEHNNTCCSWLQQHFSEGGNNIKRATSNPYDHWHDHGFGN